ncbi:MAG: hypothetical protein ABEJ68_11105 [Halobacteriaceae archaeon]
MPCSHASGGDEDDGGDSRREFLKAAVAIGGTNALSACLSAESDENGQPTDGAFTSVQPDDSPSVSGFPKGPDDLSTLPEQQHYWQNYMTSSRFGNRQVPTHQIHLYADYVGDGAPTEAERSTVESALRTVERAFQRGTGGDHNTLTVEGLLFAVGYSPAYFDRFDESLPDDLDLQTPERVVTAVGEEDVTLNTHDAFIHLLSDNASVVLATEAALFGDLDELNGVELDDDLTGILEPAARKTGFSGRGLPAKKYEEERIHEAAPLSMGFRATFLDNLPAEETMTIESGHFAGGTTAVVSEVQSHVDEWYDDTDHSDRVELMYSPDHTVDEVGETGEALAGHSGKTRETVENIPHHVDTEGRLGHGQKLAAARDEDFRTKILRRDCNRSGGPGLLFTSHQTGVGDFLDVREAMEGEKYADELPEDQNGIIHYLDTEMRGTFLIPPRTHRSLPTPTPE